MSDGPMNAEERWLQSAYMQWAKTRTRVSYDLAMSGMPPMAIRDLGIEAADLELSGSGSYGYEPLQKALAARYGIGPECIIAATGTSMANHLVMAAVLGREDEVLIEKPAYGPLIDVARYLGARIRRFERRFENRYELDAAEIERSCSSRTRLIVITNLHNPSGMPADSDALKRIGEAASECGARVLVDEVYREALFDRAGPSAFSLGSRFVATSSLTKAYGLGGLRCGWIVADPLFAKKLWQLNDLFGVNAAHPAERISVVALEKLDQIAAHAGRLLEENRRLLKKFFDEQEQLEVVLPESGTICFPRLKQGDSDRFCKLLAEKYQTAVVPGSFFEMPGHFRIGIAGPTEMVAEGLRRLGAALADVS